MDGPSPDGIILTERLTRRFNGLVAVDGLNLEVKRGEIFGLLGPNGAGKTTTIKMLTTLLPISEGQAWVDGFNVTSEAEAVRAHIGYVSQMLSTDGSLTGRENLNLSAKLYAIPRAERKTRIAQALDFMSLGDAADRLAKTYSGGMMRRLEIAQAMLHRPAILFLDEPTIGLDPVARRTVWDRLKMLQSSLSMTVLITTHDMEEAEHLCGRLAMMHKGRCAALGTPADLKRAVGAAATLDDVFIRYSGASLDEGGTYRDLRQTRTTATRLGE